VEVALVFLLKTSVTLSSTDISADKIPSSALYTILSFSLLGGFYYVEAYSLGPEHTVLHIIEHPPKRMEAWSTDEKFLKKRDQS
jgi:hypothetical protein